MLIFHLIGGAVLFASFALRMPQVSSALSLFFTTFKSMAPVSLIRQNEDVSPISLTFIDSPSFSADVASSPSPAVTNLADYHPPSKHPDWGPSTRVNVSTGFIVQELGPEGVFSSLNGDEGGPISNPTTCLNILLSVALLCAAPILYLIYTIFRFQDPNLGSSTNTLVDQADVAPGVLLTEKTEHFVIVGPERSCLDVRDYQSVVFDQAFQTQLPSSITSASEVTVTIYDENELKGDSDKMETPANLDIDSLGDSPELSPPSPASSDCLSSASDRSTGGESIPSPTSVTFGPALLSNIPSTPCVKFGIGDPDDYMYPTYNPFEEPEIDYSIYEDPDEALAVISRSSNKKRYMVGMFPGVNEFFLQRDAIPYEHFVATGHKCLDEPGLAPSDVRCCPYWYRCEKPGVTDEPQELETARILILNLNYSIVREETPNSIDKQVTVIYDSERLKPILGRLGATRMTIYCPAHLQDYPYAVVDFPSIARSKTAVQQLQGRCLGYSGRHLRVQYVPLYDYTFGGRHVASEDTRAIINVSLELDPDQLWSPRVPKPTPKPTPKKTPGRKVSPQKNSRMVVTKHGRRIQMPHNMC